MFREHIEFFRQFREQFHTTGAIAPSSQSLARAMTRHMAIKRGPARILEVGPGTGAVTRRIVTLLQSGDRLHLVEVNESFAGLLRKRFQSDLAFRCADGQAHVHVCGIESFRSDVKYDYIVSGLPFNNFSPAFVEQVMQALLVLLAPGGILSYFEYMFVRPARRLVSRKDERARLGALDDVLGGFLTRYGVSRDPVFFNMPPAWVQHLRQDASVTA